jgi:DMSO/TMAO reductase YedYZ molybdopterin-dependent catalytic subunit
LNVQLPALDLESRREPPESPSRVRRRTALLGGIIAAVVAAAGMLLLRSVLQVRTLPERLLEWLLLFMPPGQFEAMLQQFGFDAKRYALDVAVAIMLGVLGSAGYVALRRRWPAWALAATGVGFWLVVMLVVMPFTAAGVFASDLLDGKRAAIGGYLAVGLSYSAVLTLTRVLAQNRRFQNEPSTTNTALAGRRTALGVIAAAGLAYAGTYLWVMLLPRRNAPAAMVVLEDPQEPVPSGGVTIENAHPNVVENPSDQTATLGPPAPTPSSGLPEPSAARPLTRDKDGAVLPTGRNPGQLAPAMTANADFYIVTKNAGGDPFIRPDEWRLLLDGEVGQRVQLDYASLRKLPPVEVTKTLECISNFVGKPELAPFGAELIGTARWTGVRVRDVLRQAGGPKPSAAWVAVLSADEFTSALSLEAALDPGTLLVYEMNGDVLPREHGYPLRLLIPNRYGMKNAKWVIGLRLLAREFTDWYGQRHWSREAIVRTMSRIDSPAPGAVVRRGERIGSGVAYAGARGISRVEVTVDDGKTWRPAKVMDASIAGEDRWVRWGIPLTSAPSAAFTLRARATDGEGNLQIEPFSLPEPDGGTGWPSVQLRAA